MAGTVLRSAVPLVVLLVDTAATAGRHAATEKAAKATVAINERLKERILL